MAEALVERLRKGDALHREAAAALEVLGACSEFVLSDIDRGIAFLQWQRERPPKAPTPEGSENG